MPQLDLVTFSMEVIWLVIGLVIVYSSIIGKEGIIGRLSLVMKVRRKGNIV